MAYSLDSQQKVWILSNFGEPCQEDPDVRF